MSQQKRIIDLSSGEWNEVGGGNRVPRRQQVPIPVAVENPQIRKRISINTTNQPPFPPAVIAPIQKQVVTIPSPSTAPESVVDRREKNSEADNNNDSDEEDPEYADLIVKGYKTFNEVYKQNEGKIKIVFE